MVIFIVLVVVFAKAAKTPFGFCLSMTDDFFGNSGTIKLIVANRKMTTKKTDDKTKKMKIPASLSRWAVFRLLECLDSDKHVTTLPVTPVQVEMTH